MNDKLLSNSVMRQFISSLRDYAIVTLDEDGLVAGWNAGATVLTGYAFADVIGKHFSMFSTAEARTVSHPERELNVAATSGRHEEEGWRVRKDGTKFWAHVLIMPLYDDDKVLIGFAKIVRDCTERKQATEQSASMLKLLEFTARTDYLTGLDNRRSLDKALSSVLSAGRRHQRPASLAILDLDHFKKFNDGNGHQAGDKYLKQAAKCWRDTLRPEDFIARYGGEEFVVLLPDTDLAGAMSVLERIRLSTPAPLTCSVGVAQWDALENADQLIGRADRALYSAKGNNRNCVVSAPRPAFVAGHNRRIIGAATAQVGERGPV